MSKKGKTIAIIAGVIIVLAATAVIAILYAGILNAPINGTQNEENTEQNSNRNDDGYDRGLQPSSNGSSTNYNAGNTMNENTNAKNNNAGETSASQNNGTSPSNGSTSVNDNTTSTTSEIQGTQRQTAESCITNLYDSTKNNGSLDAFATDIPERYNNDQNAVVQFKRDGNTNSIQRMCKYRDAHVTSTELVSTSGGYERYKIITEATAYNSVPTDTSSASSTFNVRITSNIVVDTNGKIVYLTMSPERI